MTKQGSKSKGGLIKMEKQEEQWELDKIVISNSLYVRDLPVGWEPFAIQRRDDITCWIWLKRVKLTAPGCVNAETNGTQKADSNGG